jgi:hypothetical protein
LVAAAVAAATRKVAAAVAAATTKATVAVAIAIVAVTTAIINLQDIKSLIVKVCSP